MPPPRSVLDAIVKTLISSHKIGTGLDCKRQECAIVETPSGFEGGNISCLRKIRHSSNLNWNPGKRAQDRFSAFRIDLPYARVSYQYIAKLCPNEIWREQPVPLVEQKLGFLGVILWKIPLNHDTGIHGKSQLPFPFLTHLSGSSRSARISSALSPNTLPVAASSARMRAASAAASAIVKPACASISALTSPCTERPCRLARALRRASVCSSMPLISKSAIMRLPVMLSK